MYILLRVKFTIDEFWIDDSDVARDYNLQFTITH
jgi:hypothetical protein